MTAVSLSHISIPYLLWELYDIRQRSITGKPARYIKRYYKYYAYADIASLTITDTDVDRSEKITD